jgi:hypothetical protein
MSAHVLPPLAVNSKSERKVNSLPLLVFKPVIFGMLAHLSSHLAKSHPHIYCEMVVPALVESQSESSVAPRMTVRAQRGVENFLYLFFFRCLFAVHFILCVHRPPMWLQEYGMTCFG